MTSQLSLSVEVPISAFRPHESREYQDTHPLPPPSAVYGMLLSLCGIGRDNKGQHRGVGMVLAAESQPERSKVFRKLRRGRELGDLRPDYQDLLIDLKLWIWLADGRDQGSPKLPQRVVDALRSPERTKRFGGLSLGESSYLVDSITMSSCAPETELHFLKPDEAGFYNLPVWVDHVESSNIRWRFDIEEMSATDGLEQCWVRIGEQQDARV